MKHILVRSAVLLLAVLLAGCAPSAAIETQAAGTPTSIVTQTQSAQTQSAESLTPLENVPGKVVSIDACIETSAAVMENGDLYIWGWGNGQTRPVKKMEGMASVAMGNAGGFNTYLALSKTGELYAWGYNDCGQIGNGDPESGRIIAEEPYKVMEHVKQMDTSGSHSLAVTETGDLYVWGDNSYGQVGNGKSGQDDIKVTENAPVMVMGGIRQASAGFGYTMAVTESGELYGWGDNSYGKLGNGEYTKQIWDSIIENKPVKIMDGIESVSAGLAITCAVTTGGDLYTWGDNINGDIGNGESGDKDGDPMTIDYVVPSPYKLLTGIRTASAGWMSDFAIDTQGNLFAWGSDEYGQAGDGKHGDGNPATDDSKLLEPVQVMSGISQVTGCGHTLALNTDGELLAWGYNEYGQLGNGEKGDGDYNTADCYETEPYTVMFDPEVKEEETSTTPAFAEAMFEHTVDTSLCGVMSDGMAAAEGGIIYYASGAAYIVKIDTVGKTAENIMLKYANDEMLCVYNGYIYYMTDKWDIARISTDGSQTNTFFPRPEAAASRSRMWFDGRYIFLLMLDENSNTLTYRVDADTGESAQISGPEFTEAASDGSSFCYTIESSGAGGSTLSLVRTNIDGKHRTTLVKNVGAICDIIAVSGRVYYTKGSQEAAVNDDPGDDGCELYSVGTDGKGKHDIAGISAESFDIVGDTIYYANKDDGGRLYRVGTDGSGNSMVCDIAGISSIDIAAGWIFVRYMVPIGDGGFTGGSACVSADGSAMIPLD